MSETEGFAIVGMVEEVKWFNSWTQFKWKLNVTFQSQREFLFTGKLVVKKFLNSICKIITNVADIKFLDQIDKVSTNNKWLKLNL